MESAEYDDGENKNKEENKCAEVVDIGQSEGEEKCECEKFRTFFLECAPVAIQDNGYEKVAHSVADNAAGDKLCLRGSKGIEWSENKEGNKCNSFARNARLL